MTRFAVCAVVLAAGSTFAQDLVHWSLASDATNSVRELEQFAITSRDQIVESAYESARGYLLVSRGDFENAADELATDPRSPLALQLLAATQEKLGKADAAGTTRKRLKYQRRANVEWYLVTRGEGAKG